MKLGRYALLTLGLLTGVCGQLNAQEILTRKGWDYDRQSFCELPDKVEEAKKAGKGIPLRGWAEYDISIPKTGWYELWLGGCPQGWPRDILVDGAVITRVQSSEDEDLLKPPAKNGIQFKEANFYLTEGRHALRIQRYAPPGALPTVWELRPSKGEPGDSVRLVVDQSRIVTPGSPLELKILGGAVSSVRYDLFWKNEATEELRPAGTAEFPASKGLVENKISVVVPEAGFYSIVAKVGDQTLKPADLKAGYFLSLAPGKPMPPRSKELQFAGIFRDGVILQRQKPLPVWGWAAPGEPIKVSLNDARETATADADGRWQVTFPPMEGTKTLELVAQGKSKTIKCGNVLLGEVWLLSGQSNMGGPLLSSTGGMDAAKAANYPDVRLALLSNSAPNKDDQRLDPVSWMPAVANGDPQNLKKWIAIHYAFGTTLFNELKVPIGLVGANRGGTYLSTWASLETHEKDPSLQKMLEAYRAEDRDYVQEKVYLNKLAADFAKWRKDKKGPAPALAPLPAPRNYAALNYDMLIHPLAPFAIRGVLWHQGENDSGMAEAYRKRFPALIANWRELWKEPNLPFIFAQIAYGSGNRYQGQPGDFAGAELKEAQTMTLSVPNTAMIVTDDLMKPGDDVHYPNKLPVGQRFALAALATVYGKAGEYSGPIYKNSKVENGKIRLTFDHAKGLKAREGKLGGFAIAGEDHKWAWADAEIDGETVVVSSKDVPQPVAVRYSWAESPCGGNLVNGSDLPAAVFRTDDWPMVTAGSIFDQKN